MRRVLFFMMTTVDGYYAGPNGEIDWHNVDEEFNEFAIAQLNEVDTLLFGRDTYEMMASYWPTAGAVKDDPVVAGKMNSLPKIVFSTTLSEPHWQNTRLVRDDVAAQVARLKQEPGRDMIVLGSSVLAASFMVHGLLDEARIMVNPVVLGRGKALLAGIDDRLKLKLVKTRAFRSGNVLLYYEPDARGRG
jgi:dihydrofolate reductase